MVKKCCRCKETKGEDGFHRNTGSCKVCEKTRKRSIYLKNKDKILQRNREWKKANREYYLKKESERYFRNKEEINEKQRLHYRQNKDQYTKRVLEYRRGNQEYLDKQKEWRNKNPMKHRSYSATRRAKKKNATIGDYKSEILEIYKSCPADHEVDHIVPLQGRGVSGLHVPWNLQYLTVYENRSKGNKYEHST